MTSLSNETINCPICIDTVHAIDNVITCAGCKQLYHYACYTKHIQQSYNAGCPTCRYGETMRQDSNTTGTSAGPVSAENNHDDINNILSIVAMYYLFKKAVIICSIVTLLTLPFELFSKWKGALETWFISIVIPFGILTMYITYTNTIKPAIVSASISIIFVFITAVTRTILSTTYSKVIVIICMTSNGINIGILFSCIYALYKYRLDMQNSFNAYYNYFVNDTGMHTQEIPSTILSPLLTPSHTQSQTNLHSTDSHV